jgi:hypothetical protein
MQMVVHLAMRMVKQMAIWLEMKMVTRQAMRMAK